MTKTGSSVGRDPTCLLCRLLPFGACDFHGPCHHVNGGELVASGWFCDDCDDFFPNGTVVAGEREA